MARIMVIVVTVAILAFALACAGGQVAEYDEMGYSIPKPSPKARYDTDTLSKVELIAEITDREYGRSNWQGEVLYIHDSDRGVGIWLYYGADMGGIFVLSDDQYLR